MRHTAIVIGVILAWGQACLGAYVFEWRGSVEQIFDGTYATATLAGVNVGDAVTASVVYDPAAFADGVASGDGLKYAAPTGVQMTYTFESGGFFAHDVASVQARDGSSFDQWAWYGPSLLLLQVNDDSGSSWGAPLPSSFADVHELFRDNLGRFDFTSIQMLQLPAAEPSEARIVFIGGTYGAVTPVEASPVPAPAALLLGGLGAALVGWLRRQRRL